MSDPRLDDSTVPPEVIALGPDACRLWNMDPRGRADARWILWWLATASNEEIVAVADQVRAEREVPAEAAA